MKLYVIFDTIAEKPVTAVFAANDSDLKRYLVANFSKAPREVIEGLVVHPVWDVSMSPDLLGAPDVVEYLPPPINSVPPLV